MSSAPAPDQPLLFSIGAHPALRCPLLPGEVFEDYYFEFDHPVTLEQHLLQGGLLTGATVPSLRSLLESPMVTSAVGWLASATVKVAVPPASVVVKPDVGFTVTPAVSSSVFVTETSAGSTLL